MKKQLYCIFNTQEKAERVICSLPLSYNLRWRRYDTFTEDGFLRPLYYVWYTPQQ